MMPEQQSYFKMWIAQKRDSLKHWITGHPWGRALQVTNQYGRFLICTCGKQKEVYKGAAIALVEAAATCVDEFHFKTIGVEREADK